jgi:hypothetical protein
MCALLVGLPDVIVLALDDMPDAPLVVVVESRLEGVTMTIERPSGCDQQNPVMACWARCAFVLVGAGQRRSRRHSAAVIQPGASSFV